MAYLVDFISLAKLFILMSVCSLAIDIVGTRFVYYITLPRNYHWRQPWNWCFFGIHSGISIIEGDDDLRKLKLFDGPSTEESNSRALLVGVRYATAGNNALSTTYLDVNKVLCLIGKHDYKDEDIRILLDDPCLPDDRQPSRQNVIEGFKWLTHNARPGDRRFFYFAGHGSQVVDEDGDEEDGYDETLVLCAQDGTYENLVDDHIREEMVDKMPAGSRLMATVDSCCSGSILDLPRQLTDGFGYKPRNFLDLNTHVNINDSSQSAEDPYTARTKTIETKILSGGKELISSEEQPVARRQHATVNAKVISVSAASDNGKAMGNSKGGVLTRAFCAAMENKTVDFGCSGVVTGTTESTAPYTYGEFFGRITESLDNFNRSTGHKHSQNPEFWTGGPVEMNEQVQL
ncbi:hypothetical protein BDV93DRAFT_522624 [Ceratobasidium sp. AG-I]|nr:hypothetical protein BDV93DRAFT_522624 [Ceratobasidium sp. AG-I]